MSERAMSPVLPLAMTVLVAALAMTVWYIERELPFVWVGVALFLPVAWGLIEFLRKTPSNEVRRSVIMAGFILALPLAFTVGASLGLYNADDRSLESSGTGILIGSILIFMGNYLPKRLPPLDSTRYDAARAQKVQRFAGWVFVLAGIGYIAAWLILPSTPANIVATGLVLLAMALILGRRMLTRIRP